MKKKSALAIVLLIAILLLFSACFNSGKGMTNSYNITQENSVMTQSDTTVSTNNIDKNEYQLNSVKNGYVKKNEDNIIELKSYTDRCNMFNPCYDKEDSKTGFILVWKNANEEIPKIRKKDKIGIYDTYTEIKIVPLGNAKPSYMVPLNFGSDPVRDVAEFPVNMEDNGIHFAYPSDNIDFDSGELLTPGNPISECNEKDLTYFVNKNSDNFVYDTKGDGWGLASYRKYKVIKGEKNQEFTFGGHVGTDWTEFTSKACIEYYKIYANKNNDKISKTVPTEKTKDGYFTVDFSNLKSGIYYIVTYDVFIELV